MTIKNSIAESVFDIEFWKDLCPDLTIGEPLDEYVVPLDKNQQQDCSDHVDEEGYVHLHQPGIKGDLSALADLFDTIVEDTGLPAVFSFVYDLPWDLFKQTRNLLLPTLHDKYVLQPDIWAWRVTAGQAGWRPHRDMPGGIFPDTLRPKQMVVWIPVTKAYPLNSCMYVVPKPYDKKYAELGEDKFAGRFPDVRALPSEAGDILSWTPRVFHWGSRSADKHNMRPRMSIACAFQRSDVDSYNDFWLDPAAAPDFEIRLHVIAKQILQYRHMYAFTDDLVSLAETIMDKIDPPESYRP